MDADVYRISLELVFSCIAMIIGVSTFLSSKSKEGKENGKVIAEIQTTLKHILNTLNDLNERMSEIGKRNEDNRDRIIEIEKRILAQDIRLNSIERKLDICDEKENIHE